MKLSEKQKESIAWLRINGKRKIERVNRHTQKSLMKLKLVDYDDSFKYLILTELGKTIQL